MSTDLSKREENFHKYMDMISAESDRGAALLVAAIMDELLSDIISAFLADTDTARDLLKHRGLDTFSSRILICHALGLITTEEKNHLEIIRKIRNSFAHKWDSVNFETQQIRDLANNLTWTTDVEHSIPATPTTRFVMTSVLLIINLQFRSISIVEQKRTIRISDK